MNKTIVALLNSRQKATQVQAIGKLYAGQRVEWTGRSGIPMTGIVTKVMVKMVEVNAGLLGLWNVSATMLKSVA
jgi:hypothetical protein